MTAHENKDQRVVQIIEAASELFAKNGFDRTSVDDIARKAGLSKGAIYWYFPSKEKILISIAENFESDEQQAVVAMAAESELGTKALYLSHRRLFELRSADSLSDQLLHELIAMSAKYPEIADALERSVQKWCDVVEGLLQGGIDHGEFKPFNARLVSEAIAMLYRGACTMKFEEPGRAVDVIEYAAKLFYNTLTNDEPVSLTETREKVA